MLLPCHQSRVHEMLHVARECTTSQDSSPSSPGGGGTTTTSTSVGHLTFGEFCLFTTELKRCYERDTPRLAILSKMSEKSTVDKKRAERKMSKASPQYEVFLGGSCGNTTWRQDLAIPRLKENGISFYNPQVTHWSEALIELEYHAKQTSMVLFYVLDRETRNIVSMVEAAYLSGSQRKLILVLDCYRRPGDLICGESVSEQEHQELVNGINTVQDLVERQGIPVFGDMNHALNCTAKILRENIWPQDLGIEDQVQPIKHPTLQLGDKLIKLHDAFVNTNSEHITLAEARVAYKVVTNKELTTEELQAIVEAKKGLQIHELNGQELPLNEVCLTFEEFCCIVAEFKNQRLESRRLWDIFHSVMTPIQKVIGWALPRRPLRPISSTGVRDVYLGGSIGTGVSWREDLAIPMLRKHGLSFFNPATGACSGRLLPMEAALIEHSRTLLFVINGNTRAVAQMATASHYLGMGCDLVLCIQMLQEGEPLSNGETLTRLAVKDYNRGRSYLRDQANKDGIPVFDNIQEAVDCVIQKCRNR
ncbi:unnamed protein product [Meganyctiphanes norvegica]|uniref:Raw n=1 Tax=Meganyctiphanes norvegica TaxID=48144 RepID=A0AAV2R8P4_MEGNR